MLTVVSQKQAAFFQRVLNELDARGADFDISTGYTAEQLRAALDGVDVGALPSAAHEKPERPCGCGACAQTVSNRRKYAHNCPNQKPKKPRQSRYKVLAEAQWKWSRELEEGFWELVEPPDFAKGSVKRLVEYEPGKVAWVEKVRDLPKKKGTKAN